MLTTQQLQRAAGDMGFPTESLEKVWMLVRVMNLLSAHPFLRPRLALKGGTALNLFVFDLPRLSVDIDVNYVGAADRETMMAERPNIETAIQQVAGRLGLGLKRVPREHAGGKWRLSYTSALGRPAIIELDVNFMLRSPLWPLTKRDSRTIIDARVEDMPVLDDHELAAGKLAALFARRASRDLFDARELLSSASLDTKKLRLGFVVYGGINRVDWRTVSIDDVSAVVEDVKRQLLPMLRHDIRPAPKDVAAWTDALVQETRDLLGAVLPLEDDEMAFLGHLNGNGEIHPELLTDDDGLQQRIVSHPALLWKSANVKGHLGTPITKA